MRQIRRKLKLKLRIDAYNWIARRKIEGKMVLLASYDKKIIGGYFHWHEEK
jgi:hypothetical protein